MIEQTERCELIYHLGLQSGRSGQSKLATNATAESIERFRANILIDATIFNFQLKNLSLTWLSHLLFDSRLNFMIFIGP